MKVLFGLLVLVIAICILGFGIQVLFNMDEM